MELMFRNSKSQLVRAIMTIRQVVLLILVACAYGRSPGVAHYDDEVKHPTPKKTTPRSDVRDEMSAEFWIDMAQNLITKKLTQTNNNVAKNVIFFIGDGLSIPTLAAARAYMGQKLGQPGEEYEMSFEKFPVAGLAKTYCVDYQVADSACTATAFLSGIKNNFGTVGVTANVSYGDCQAELYEGNLVDGMATWALKAEKDAGLVTNTRITHATPSALYAHSANRDWESDSDVIADGLDPEVCRDIAHQLVHRSPGSNLKVILGGGRAQFLPREVDDGTRYDGENLIETWAQDKKDRGFTSEYVATLEELNNVDVTNTDFLLGLFEPSHMKYNLETDPETEPTLTDLTKKAIEMLSKNDKGYALFIESGRIDHAHHFNWARKALDETAELARAVEAAVELTSRDDTLIVVSADHAHVMAFNGYPLRANPILETNGETFWTPDGMEHMTLSYTNGPGHILNQETCGRIDPTTFNFSDITLMHTSEVMLNQETHGGDDVAVFALGPQQHLFTGLYEQSALPHIMAYAACIGDGQTACNGAYSEKFHLILIFTLTILTIKLFTY